MRETEKQLFDMKVRWQNRTPGVIERQHNRHSSVVLPLIERDGRLEVLFEVRAASLHRQPNEVCFPGGIVESGETYEEAAIRETAEELLIDLSQVHLIAPLDYLEMSSGLTVHVYLCEIKDYHGTFSKDEVDRVFSVPLSWFLEHEPDKYVAKIRTTPGEDFPFDLVPGGRNYNWHSGHYNVYFYPYEQEVIWGMTAKILYGFVKLNRGECL